MLSPRHSMISLAAGALLAGGALASCSDEAPTTGASTPPPLPAPATRTPGGATERAAVGKPRDLVTGLELPWAIAFLPGGDALVTERDSARLLRVTPQGKVREVGKVPGVEPLGEGGLMGVAVSPGYPQDRYVYLYFTASDDNRVVRFQYRDRIGRLDPIITGIPKGGNHNGGRIAFGPDRMLYVATGETGDPPLAQDRGSLGGKILRVTAEGRPASGNPFGTRVWTYGHRNVQGLAWDERGRMFATEFGQDRLDEINRILPGRNYGWPRVEGVGNDDSFTDPLLTWSTNEASPSGLAYARGSLWAAALRGERLWQVPLSADGEPGRPIARLTGDHGRLRAVVPAPDGSLWITTSDRDDRGRVHDGDDRILVVPLS